MAKPNAEEFPLLFYDIKTKEYWRQCKGWYLPLGDANAKLHLRQAGCYGGKVEDGLNEVERALFVAQMERAVYYAGPLAGYRVGLYTLPNGFKILVTSEARPSVFTVPKGSQDFPHLEQFLQELFGPDQLPTVLAWLKFGLASLRAGDFRPGQLLVLVGPPSCGKSLFQALLTELLGGRSANPFDYLTGRTNFNEDLAAAEHWLMEEATGSTDIRVRLHFADAIKAATVGSIFRVHGKCKRAEAVQTYRRMSLSINDSHESILVLPPLDGVNGIGDKVILCRCSPATIGHDRKETWSRLAGELPALAAWLHGWRVPKSMTDERFGVRHYHAPDILDILCDLSPESRLEQLIDATVFAKHDPKDGPWTGSALELERQLRSSAFAPSVETLLRYSSACGVYLARLATKQPDRFSCYKVKGKTQWRIVAP